MIMKLRRCNLREMMKQKLLNDQIKTQILEGLKTIVTVDLRTHSNGDLKERGYKICQYYLGCFSEIQK